MSNYVKTDQLSGKRGSESKNRINLRAKSRWVAAGAVVTVALLIVFGAWLVSQGRASAPTEAPEAHKVLDVQANMPFQILIPAFLPKDFRRAEMVIDVDQLGPGGEPMVQLTYRTKNGSKLFIREWVPVNPELEVLAASRPIQTKWGRGWLLRQGDNLAVIWVDIGPLRTSIFTRDQSILPKEKLLAVAENMGPASNRQVFSFVVNPPEIHEVEPPPPVEIPINDQGIQEVDLIVTPGGYTPLRFSVQKGLPVRVNFRQLGQVGCGNELNLPVGPNQLVSLKLESASDKQVYEFVPEHVGEFQFFCAHLMYRGIMTVRE